jgi:hypothetical protein
MSWHASAKPVAARQVPAKLFDRQVPWFLDVCSVNGNCVSAFSKVVQSSSTFSITPFITFTPATLRMNV